MTFKTGQIANPNGRRGEFKFLRALERELDEKPKGKNKKPKLSQLAAKLYREAMKGKAWAMIQIIDRLDGKATEHITHEAGGELADMFRFIAERTRAKLPENAKLIDGERVE